MSLYDDAIEEMVETGAGYKKAVQVWDWIRKNIDFEKFRRRAAYSRSNACEQKLVKVVLMEYSGDLVTDGSVTYHYVPGTYVRTNYLQKNSKMMDYLHYKISNRNPNVQVYTRRKIVDGKEPHPFIRQIVVTFKCNSPPVSPIIPVQRTPQESLDSESLY